MYRLTPTAASDLRSIAACLAPAPSRIRTRVLLDLATTFEQADRHTASGRFEPELSTALKPVRSLLCFPYRIFYYPETHPVLIFAILHGKRDPLAILKG